MLLQLLGSLQPGSPARWPRTAIHDTVAAIVTQRAYSRSLRQTLLERIVRWIGELYQWLGDALGGVPHARRAATVAAIALALIVLGRLLYAARLREDRAPRGRRVSTGRRTVPDAWHEAERLAGLGQYTEAAHELYRGVITLLARAGHVHPHPSKTSGDYARELRSRRSPVHTAFREFGRRYERMLFGSGRCDRSEYEALLGHARPLLAALEGERAA